MADRYAFLDNPIVWVSALLLLPALFLVGSALVRFNRIDTLTDVSHGRSRRFGRGDPVTVIFILVVVVIARLARIYVSRSGYHYHYHYHYHGNGGWF
jgi:hypothetical protein